MAVTVEHSSGDPASQLNKVNDKVKAEGFASVEELVSSYQTACADRDKAVAARDKFNAANDEARTIIRTKGSEIGTLNQEIEGLKAAASGADQGTGAPAAQPPSSAPPTAPVLSEEEELSQVEASLSDEHWNAADTLLGTMTDEEATLVAEDKKIRLAFLKELKGDKEIVPVARPKSLRPVAEEKAPAAVSADTLLAEFKKRLRGPLRGPSGVPTVGKTRATERVAASPDGSWMHGA